MNNYYNNSNDVTINDVRSQSAFGALMRKVYVWMTMAMARLWQGLQREILCRSMVSPVQHRKQSKADRIRWRGIDHSHDL